MYAKEVKDDYYYIIVWKHAMRIISISISIHSTGPYSIAFKSYFRESTQIAEQIG